jgi:thiol-disulfide isomerase/thioredoxin
MFLHRLGKVHAPEFPKEMTWFNSNPLTMKSLLGKAVLIDFWTYSCVNCLRTTPHLRAWHEAYEEKGLAIIGVHTPEFDFEKQEKKVAKAVKDLEIDYPVVLDADYKIWNLYANRWWPRKFLIDQKGVIVYDHIGEGGYAETELAIQKALIDIGAKNLPVIKPDAPVGGGICYRTSPETYLGFLRGRFGNANEMLPNKESAFTDKEKNHQDDLIYLHGHWHITKESIKHERKLSHATEYLLMKYSAFSVNLVMGGVCKKGSVIEIELDGHPLPEDMAGEDVVIGKNKKATVTVGHPRMYKLVDADTYHQGTLKLKTKDEGLEMFAFTFGGCKGI